MKLVQDERIVLERRIIQSRAFAMLLMGLWLILIYRMLVRQDPPQENLDLLLLVLAVSVYHLGSLVSKGLIDNPQKKDRRLPVISGVVGGLAFFIVQIISNGIAWGDWNAMVPFVILSMVFMVFFVASQLMLGYMTEKKVKEEIDALERDG
jgi:hypothetical protein